MKKVSIDTWIQLLGMLSVVAGLVFVGLEMQQTQRIALANQQQARTELNSNRLLTELELLGEIGPDAITSAVEWDEMTVQQQAIRQQIQRWFWALLENHFFQNEMELLTDSLWSQVENYINARYSECHLRDILGDCATARFNSIVLSVNDSYSRAFSSSLFNFISYATNVIETNRPKAPISSPMAPISSQDIFHSSNSNLKVRLLYLKQRTNRPMPPKNNILS